MYCIYTLTDPRDMQVHYVGLTKNTRQRLNAHMGDPEGSQQKHEWLQELKQVGLKPIMDIVEDGLAREQAFEQERNWIRFYVSQNATLYNYTIPKIRPEEVANLLKEYHALLAQFSPEDSQWLEAKDSLQERARELLTELEVNYVIRPFVRYQGKRTA